MTILARGYYLFRDLTFAVLENIIALERENVLAILSVCDIRSCSQVSRRMRLNVLSEEKKNSYIPVLYISMRTTISCCGTHRITQIIVYKTTYSEEFNLESSI